MGGDEEKRDHVYDFKCVALLIVGHITVMFVAIDHRLRVELAEMEARLMAAKITESNAIQEPSPSEETFMPLTLFSFIIGVLVANLGFNFYK
jgi:hypothetical protein